MSSVTSSAIPPEDAPTPASAPAPGLAPQVARSTHRRHSFKTFMHIARSREVHDRIEPVAFGCLRKEGRFRRAMIEAMLSPARDAFIGLVVLLLACALCAFDPLDPASSRRNFIIETISLTVTCILAVDLVVRIVAMGFTGKAGFLSDPWNWFDIGVVALGYACLHPDVRQFGSLRILALVRWMTNFPGMNVVMRAGFRALPGVLGVLLLSLLIYVVWGLIAVQLWSGLLHGNCFYDDPVTGDPTPDPDGAFCALPCSAFEHSCTPSWGDDCRSAFALDSTGAMATVPMTCRPGSAPSYDQAHVDNVGYSTLFAFVLVTTEGWSSMMYATWHVWGYAVRKSFTAYVFPSAFPRALLPYLSNRRVL
jgi:hypothetical protein